MGCDLSKCLKNLKKFYKFKEFSDENDEKQQLTLPQEEVESQEEKDIIIPNKNNLLHQYIIQKQHINNEKIIKNITAYYLPQIIQINAQTIEKSKSMEEILLTKNIGKQNNLIELQNITDVRIFNIQISSYEKNHSFNIAGNIDEFQIEDYKNMIKMFRWRRFLEWNQQEIFRVFSDMKKECEFNCIGDIYREIQNEKMVFFNFSGDKYLEFWELKSLFQGYKCKKIGSAYQVMEKVKNQVDKFLIKIDYKGRKTEKIQKVYYKAESIMFEEIEKIQKAGKEQQGENNVNTREKFSRAEGRCVGCNEIIYQFNCELYDKIQDLAEFQHYMGENM